MLQRDQFGQKFPLEGGRPQQPFFLSVNKDERYFMWYKIVGTSFCRFVTTFTRFQTDGQTDRLTDEHLAHGYTVRSSRHLCSRTVQTLNYLKEEVISKLKTGAVLFY